jgi:hypothetical protein
MSSRDRFQLWKNGGDMASATEAEHHNKSMRAVKSLGLSGSAATAFCSTSAEPSAAATMKHIKAG